MRGGALRPTATHTASVTTVATLFPVGRSAETIDIAAALLETWVARHLLCSPRSPNMPGLSDAHLDEILRTSLIDWHFIASSCTNRPKCLARNFWTLPRRSALGQQEIDALFPSRKSDSAG